MPEFEIAHFEEDGQQVIVVFVTSSFGMQSQSEQNTVRYELQQHASNAGLAGTVALVWSDGVSMGFLAPIEWHDFFDSVSYDNLVANINGTLSW